MGCVLIIAEKPAQAKAYSLAFKNAKKQDGYYEIPSCDVFPTSAKITWAIGHLVTLKEPHDYNEKWKNWSLQSLPLIPTEFEFKISPDKTKQFNIIKKLIHESESIIVGTDIDREGENIARSILSLAGGSHKPTKRLWINSLEEDEIVKGFMNLKDGNDYLSYYEEAKARQISDWLVGLNSSRLYTLLLQGKGIKEVFSVGRVQTPTLKLIYDRQKEIENFKPEPFYEIQADIQIHNQKFKGKYKERFSDEKSVEQLYKEHQVPSPPKQLNANIQKVKKDVKKKQAPQLHSLSSLQTLANKKFKYSPAKVLSLVQELYDNPLKLVTYPRTDTNHITESEFAYLKQNVEGYQKIINKPFEPYTMEANKRYVDNKKVQEHYAIVPTKKIPTESVLNSLTKEQKDIYFELIKSVLGMFHAPYQYEETVIETNVHGLLFETKGIVEQVKGWKELYVEDQVEKDQTDEENQTLPAVEIGDSCLAELITKEGKTQAPKRYTEGQLINLMKTCGSGNSLDDLADDEKSILKEIEGLGTEATRSGIIETLKRQKYIEVKRNIVHVTSKGEILCQVVEGTLLSKPELTAKWESYLKKIGQKTGSSKTFISNTITFTEKLIRETKEQIGSINIDKQITSMNTADHIAQCPTCKTGAIVDRKSFYGCTEYKNGCKQSFPKEKNSKKISKTQIKQLCEKGKTGKIKGFKKKDEKEKTFEASLILENGFLKFSFK